MSVVANTAVRSFLSKPPAPDPPRRVWRDWVLVAVYGVAAVLEGALRTDVEWRIASIVIVLAMTPTLLYRRTHPLAMTVVSFVTANVFGAMVAVATDTYGGLYTTAAVLVMPYALFRWASGRDAGIGIVVMVSAAVLGIAFDPGTVGDAIGGFTVLAIPALLGAMVRAETSSRDRAFEEVKLRERELLARELHDSVAHHVSAIAVQAQAGQAMAMTDPAAAVGVLAVIEEAASRTLDEMRSMVGTLRAGDPAALAPQQRIIDIARLADSGPGRLQVEVELAGTFDDVRPAVDVAVYRIAQEAVTNAVRHAKGASLATVRIVGHDDTISLEVHDDGEVAPADRRGVTGYGLLGMAERATLIGGTMTAGPGGSGGWVVLAEFPRTGV